jgi:histidine triad (HIT) family protein
MENEKCFICEKHENGVDIVFQDSMVSVSHMVRHPDSSDNYLGYYMVESMRHFRGMYDATDEEMAVIGKMLKELSKALMDILNAAHVYAFVIGEGLNHFHIHVVARYKDAPREYWGPSVDEWPDAPRGTLQDVRNLNEKIRNEILKTYQRS